MHTSLNAQKMYNQFLWHSMVDFIFFGAWKRLSVPVVRILTNGHNAGTCFDCPEKRKKCWPICVRRSSFVSTALHVSEWSIFYVDFMLCVYLLWVIARNGCDVRIYVYIIKIEVYCNYFICYHFVRCDAKFLELCARHVKSYLWTLTTDAADAFKNIAKLFEWDAWHHNFTVCISSPRERAEM